MSFKRIVVDFGVVVAIEKFWYEQEEKAYPLSKERSTETLSPFLTSNTFLFTEKLLPSTMVILILSSRLDVAEPVQEDSKTIESNNGKANLIFLYFCCIMTPVIVIQIFTERRSRNVNITGRTIF